MQTLPMPEDGSSSSTSYGSGHDFGQIPIYSTSSTEIPQSEQAPIQRDEDESSWKGVFDNPIWNTVTNNAISGGTAILENAWTGINTLPTLTRGLMSGLGAERGMNLGFALEDALAAPANTLPNALRPVEGLGGISRLSAALAPIGAISNAMGVYDAIARPGNNWLEKGGDAIANAAGFFSSAVGTVGLAGSGLSAAGATGAGGALTGAAAGLGPAAGVAGAAAGGYAFGRLLDEGMGGLMNATGASAALDSVQGISRGEGQHGDYSLSGLGALAATQVDQGFTSVMRSVGAYDESRPAYTQTLGWQLAEILPSWMQ